MGASGALYGILGGILVTPVFRRVAPQNRGWWKVVLLAAWTIYDVYPTPATAKLTFVAHIAGLGTGMLLGAALSLEFTRRTKQRWIWIGIGVLLIVASSVLRQVRDYIVPLGHGMHALRKGQTVYALSELQSAYNKNPNSFLVNLGMAEAYVTAEEYDQAEDSARRAVAADPQNEKAEYLLGVILLHRGYCNEAHDIGDHLSLRAKDQRYDKAGWALSISKCDDVGSADRFLAEGHTDFAIGWYKHALAVNPKDYHALRGLAKAYRVNGAQAEADAADRAADAIHKRL